ncbi:dTDP-4-dehydrorhamnose reductase [Maribacter sp. MAR_2009_72]|uniref:dTDP-4-dehydrorhamnose reductase n=1 Tax=Maribacter sp. MAR_2009_72 TaxID=1250050 RepID=UPI00119A091E|nr:dTDP-4-dehydrorhamnose reductase [Maribacter sp. MAR_2009_72]TVZ16170.1 dTDP-4-dehydrorhamnose reductase [Maribacter sp. MAR_2009_72]
MKKILVTGGQGQLANCINDITKNNNELHVVYVDIDTLDITDKNAVTSYFKQNNFNYCINCAAYTAVDNAESNHELAEQVNYVGAQNLAYTCKDYNVTLIHISTDFVFDGKQTKFYTEEDLAQPLSVYGNTKLEGERAIANILNEHFIIRTSWLYSEHGNNFLKTMLRLGSERDELSVVVDQIGTPTYAGDLANVILDLIQKNATSYGLYHYSNEGVASWYDFAVAIFEIANIKIKVAPIKTEAYPTPAKRPSNSIMDKTKIKETFNLTIPYWRKSLENCIKTNKL